MSGNTDKKNKKEQGFITKILHTPLLKKDPHGTMRAPVYENVAFAFDS